MHVLKKKRHPPSTALTRSKVFNIRCHPIEVERWTSQAKKLGYNGAGTWLRHLANEAVDRSKP
jgi:hypothetical protein